VTAPTPGQAFHASLTSSQAGRFPGYEVRRYECLLDRFSRGSDGYRARLSGVVLAREYRDAGLPVPDRLSHLEGK
jgi:hypothetical protein